MLKAVVGAIVVQWIALLHQSKKVLHQLPQSMLEPDVGDVKWAKKKFKSGGSGDGLHGS